MTQNLTDDLCLGNGGNDSQRPLLTHRTAFHIEAKHSLEQLGPVPAGESLRACGCATPCWCGVGTITTRSLLGGARHPP